MSRFKSHLDAYLRGEVNFTSLAEHLSAAITGDPSESASTRQAIQAAEERGLPEPVSRALQKLLPAATSSSHMSANPADTNEISTEFGIRAAAGAARREANHGYAHDGANITRDLTDRHPDTTPTTEHAGRGLPQSWSEVRSSRSRFLFAEPTANQPTESGLGKQGASTNAQSAIGPGFVLKDRFELQQPLGEGGMGVVYRAVDRLKVEAGDKNPFLAIKLLASDLRSQRGGFIALQREASKAQRLAHPNIATVYDFDRDGDTIFMTMELLEGQPLSRIIRDARPAGLPIGQAMHIIQQLGSALDYAHKHELVHSDLKPGNCFVTEDGRVKLLDFGIARASKARSDVEGDRTLFDPGDLGALTPAYASLEMFDALPPDPRDDIYALACISYEVIAGHHPFDRLAAPRAKAKNLRPKRVPGVGRRQFQGLRRALAFDRDHRTPTVEQFLSDISPDHDRRLRVIAAGMSGLLLAAAVAYQPVTGHLAGKRNQRLSAIIQDGSEPEAMAAVASLEDLDPESRDAVLDANREAIIGLYERRAQRAFNVDLQRYDYPGAEQQVHAARRFFPDSARVLLMSSALETSRDELLASLTARYGRNADQGRLLPVEGEEDMVDVLEILRQVAPNHPLLSSRRLPLRYAQEVEKAMANGDLARASELLDVGAANTSGSPILDSLRDRLARRLSGEGN